MLALYKKIKNNSYGIQEKVLVDDMSTVWDEAENGVPRLWLLFDNK